MAVLTERGNLNTGRAPREEWVLPQAKRQSRREDRTDPPHPAPSEEHGPADRGLLASSMGL